MGYYIKKIFQGVLGLFFVLMGIEATVFVFCIAKEFVVKSYNYCKEHCFQVNQQEEDINVPLNNAPPDNHIGIELAGAHNAGAEPV